ncbi:hypothetical protein TWF173_004273 [Orbilia oligospora]|nr:hypothetical protein TWF173_004273 [Orbilia oligospora]
MGIEHGIAERLRRAGGHDSLAVSAEVESLSGGVERMDLRTGSAGTLENYSQKRPNYIAGLAEREPEKRETQEAHNLSKNRDREPVNTIKHEVPERFKSTDPDLDTDSENDELEVEKFKFVISKASENFDSKNWEKSEEYWKAAIKIWETVRNHPGMEGFRIPSPKPHEGGLDKKWILVYLAWSQLCQKKPKEALQTINLLSDEAARANTDFHGVFEWTKAGAYSLLGDLKEARRLCRKAVKLAREANDLKLSYVFIEFMVQILKRIEGPEGIEVEFYKSLLPLKSEGASKKVLKGTDEPD